MKKTKISIYLGEETKKLLDDIYVAGIQNGNKMSYGEIVTLALQSWCKEFIGEE